MKTPPWIPVLFGLTALYDGLLGLLFLIAPGYPFERFSVTPPNHLGYVQFPAAVLLIFTWMFLRIAFDPQGQRHLIPYGILLKLAYVGVSGWHWWSAGIPAMWKPFTVIDAATVILFVAAYARLSGQGGRSDRGHMTAAVLFDMDGVLVDSEPIINAAAIRALAEFGIRARPEDFERFVGAGENRYVGGVAELHGRTFIPEMKRRTYDWYLKLLPGMGKAFPGARELVERLRQRGIPCAVASSADRIKVEANLTTVLQVPLERFGALVTGEDVTRRKPHPDIFLEAARRLKIPANACCVIEDAVNGVEAAKAAGMRCVAVATSFPAETLAAAGADLVRRAILEITLGDLGLA